MTATKRTSLADSQNCVVPASYKTVKFVSIIVPVYNEEESLPQMESALFAVAEKLGVPFEIIAVNDGSRDRTPEILAEIAARRPQFRVVNFRRNFGQTAAMMAGIDYAHGDVIVSIDSDLQNDPADIPRLLETLDEGHDVVSGWRKNRQDAAIRRNFVSRIANRIISRISGVELHDYGCTLKAYRRDVIKGIRLYGEMHRFIPIYAKWMGARVTELVVNHRARQFGQSKYGLERTLKVVLDLMVIKFLDKYFSKPIYIFGGFGALAIAGSLFSTALMIYLKLFQDVAMIRTPLPMLSAMLFLIGSAAVLMGLLAEILVRTYFESQNRPAYSVGSVLNIDEIKTSV